MSDVFISFSSKEYEFADNIRNYLSQSDISVFLAPVSISAGSKWNDEIKRNLKVAKWVIFLASKNACNSPYVQQELGGAIFSSEKKLIPIVWEFEPENLPGWVKEYQAIDIRNASKDFLARQLDRLVHDIKDHKALVTGTFVCAAILIAAIYALRKA